MRVGRTAACEEIRAGSHGRARTQTALKQKDNTGFVLNMEWDRKLEKGFNDEHCIGRTGEMNKFGI